MIERDLLLVPFRWLAVIAILTTGFGCSQAARGPERHKTFPVYGIVEVNGLPAEGVFITCHPNKAASEYSQTLGTLTGDDGKFAFSTYQEKDGLPEGVYKLVFKWQKLGLDATVDQLQGAYDSPTKSKIEIVVGPGEKNDLGVIELSASVPRT